MRRHRIQPSWLPCAPSRPDASVPAHRAGWRACCRSPRAPATPMTRRPATGPRASRWSSRSDPARTGSRPRRATTSQNDVGAVLTTYVVEGFLGDYPRDDFVGALDSFTSGVADDAARGPRSHHRRRVRGQRRMRSWPPSSRRASRPSRPAGRWWGSPPWSTSRSTSPRAAPLARRHVHGRLMLRPRTAPGRSSASTLKPGRSGGGRVMRRLRRVAAALASEQGSCSCRTPLPRPTAVQPGPGRGVHRGRLRGRRRRGRAGAGLRLGRAMPMPSS